MNWKNIGNWLLSGVLWSLGTTFTAFQVVPNMDWKAALTVAGTTFAAALVQHLRETVNLIESK